jgi:hypothetical protein
MHRKDIASVFKVTHISSHQEKLNKQHASNAERKLVYLWLSLGYKYTPDYNHGTKIDGRNLFL